jgi:hypothetical protein
MLVCKVRGPKTVRKVKEAKMGQQADALVAWLRFTYFPSTWGGFRMSWHMVL